jgi:AcrR family transcriptional regulator
MDQLLVQHASPVPILVDRERQREHVAQIAAQVIAKEGVSALTFRRMAAAAGTSTAIVSTYFEDKQDLLLATFASAAKRTSVRFETAMDEGGGLQECLEAWLPLDEERTLDWRVIIAFWGVAVNEPDLAAVQEAHLTRARRRIERFILQTRKAPRVTSDIARTAEKVLALTLGIAFQAVFTEGAAGLPQRDLLASGLTELKAIPARRRR